MREKTEELREKERCREKGREMEKSRKIGARSLAERWRKKKEAWGAAQRDREGGEGEEEGRGDRER